MKKFKRFFSNNNPPRIIALDYKKINRCESNLSILLDSIIKFHGTLTHKDDKI